MAEDEVLEIVDSMLKAVDDGTEDHTGEHPSIDFGEFLEAMRPRKTKVGKEDPVRCICVAVVWC